MKPIIIAGTDTGIGKTLCSALLMSVLKGTYFKPVQSGCKEDNDTNMVKALSELDNEHFLKEKYLLTEPLSPHLAAEIDNKPINISDLSLPKDVKFKPLIAELAGGLMVPLNRQTLYIDIAKKWAEENNAHVILCARSSLGTINHALLSIEALKARNVPIAGIVFIGDGLEDNRKTTVQFSGVPQLGFIPTLKKINRVSLTDTFYDNFNIKYFKENYEL